MPRTPNAHPSGQPLPPRLAQTKTPAAGASAKDRVQPTPMEADKDPPQTRVESCPPLARVESLLPLTRVESRPPPAKAESLPPLARVGSHPLPAKAVNWPPQAEVGHQPPQEVLLTLPQVGEEWVIVPGPTGTK